MYQSPDNIKIIKQTMIYFLIGAATLIIALSWNDAFTNLIQKIFPNKSTNVIGHFLYATILTLVFTILTITLVDPEYLTNFNFLYTQDQSVDIINNNTNNTNTNNTNNTKITAVPIPYLIKKK